MKRKRARSALWCARRPTSKARGRAGGAELPQIFEGAKTATDCGAPSHGQTSSNRAARRVELVETGDVRHLDLQRVAPDGELAVVPAGAVEAPPFVRAGGNTVRRRTKHGAAGGRHRGDHCHGFRPNKARVSLREQPG